MTVKVHKRAVATSACSDMAAAINLGYSSQRLAAQLQNPPNRLSPRIRFVDPASPAQVQAREDDTEMAA